jgi:hypothetical protein
VSKEEPNIVLQKVQDNDYNNIQSRYGNKIITVWYVDNIMTFRSLSSCSSCILGTHREDSDSY